MIDGLTIADPCPVCGLVTRDHRDLADDCRGMLIVLHGVFDACDPAETPRAARAIEWAEAVLAR